MRERNKLEVMLHDAAGRLSAMHVAALVAHPEAVRSALTAADALTANDREGWSEVERIEGPVSSPVDGDAADRRLAAWTEFRTRRSVHDWRRKGKIIGWQNTKRGYVFPAGQLDERNRPLAGLDRVAGLFADGYSAWVWLTTPRPSLDGAKPLVLLARGEIERVAEAAQGDRQGDCA